MTTRTGWQLRSPSIRNLRRCLGVRGGWIWRRECKGTWFWRGVSFMSDVVEIPYVLKTCLELAFLGCLGFLGPQETRSFLCSVNDHTLDEVLMITLDGMHAFASRYVMDISPKSSISL